MTSQTTDSSPSARPPGSSSLLAWRNDAECLASLRALAPELHVCEPAAHTNFAAFAFAPEALAQTSTLMRAEGYFQLDPPQWNLPLPAMAGLVMRLQELGLPAPLCYLYDEFWLIFMKLHGVLSGLLGSQYRKLPDFWAWCVGGEQGDERGWSPHRDKGNGVALNPDGSPKSLTIWIPLTDATPLNGCMYIIPADRDRAYPKGTAEFDLADIRALPAQAGSVFFWNQAVYHWGGRRSPRHKLPPRVSIAFEFQSMDAPPFNQPLLEPLGLPDLFFRTQLIAKQVLQYQHMYPLSAEARSWAEGALAAAARQT